MLPPISDPTPRMEPPAAIRAPSPPLEPPGERSCACALDAAPSIGLVHSTLRKRMFMHV